MKHFTIVAALLFLANNIYAKNPNNVNSLIFNKCGSFVENKGQLMGRNGNKLNNIKFYTHTGDVDVFCKSGMISFLFTHFEKKKKASFRVSR